MEEQRKQQQCPPRPWYWLAAKGHKPSKTAFWLCIIMANVCALLIVITVRLAVIPAEYFVEALVGGSAFFAFITWIITRLYHQGKNGPPPQQGGGGGYGGGAGPGYD
jgi:hypothetical protein